MKTHGDHFCFVFGFSFVLSFCGRCITADNSNQPCSSAAFYFPCSFSLGFGVPPDKLFVWRRPTGRRLYKQYACLSLRDRILTQSYFIVSSFLRICKNPCVKTVWVCLDSIRAGITFTAMILSRYIPAENKISPMLSSRLLSAMFCNKTYVCFIQLD